MRLPEVGTLFQSKYRLDDVLGSGGFATVFRATDVAADRVVAMKILKPELSGYPPEVESRFAREVKIVARLRDEHTLTMFDFGRSEDGLLYMVTEYVPGEDLSKLLRRRKRLEPPEVIHLVRQILYSLREAHAAGLLHRDIKPANIRIYEWLGDPLRVKVLDFGIARPVREVGKDGITRDGELIGTPKYMSPEQLLSGDLTPSTDLYSVGVVAFELLFGSQSIHGSSLHDQLGRLATGHVFSVPEIDRIGAPLARFLERLSAREPSSRFRTADEALAALAAFAPPQRSGLHSSDSGVRPQRVSEELLPIHGASWNHTPPGLLPPPDATPRTGSFDNLARPIPPTDPGYHPATPARSATRVVAAAVVLVCACVAAAAALVAVASDDEPEPASPPQATARAPSALVRQERPATVEHAPPPPVIATADAGADADDSPKLSPGCGVAPRLRGRGVLRATDGLATREWEAYVPREYDRTTGHALIVMAHENAESPDEFLTYSRFIPLADEHGIVLIAPNGGFPYAWEKVDGVAAIRQAIDDARTELCIDPDRVFAVGHAAGGRVVEEAACVGGLFAAIATTSYRGTAGDIRKTCKPIPPVPYIQLAPLRDGYNPVKGGVSCSGAKKVSLDEQENLWKGFYRCKPRKQVWYQERKNVCHAFTCDAPLVMCHLDGGRNWPGTKARIWDQVSGNHCDGTPADFPYSEQIWQFFTEQSRPDEAQ